MEISSAAASQNIERLVQSGLVERAEDPEDRRVRQVALTDKGREFVKASLEQRFNWVEELITGLEDEDRNVVLRALPILMDAERRLSGERAPDGNKNPAPTTLS